MLFFYNKNSAYFMFNINKFREIKEIIKKNNQSCQIIAISKNHPKEAVINAIENGVNSFGENRVVEADEKFRDLKKLYPNITLHLTGPLQSNKTKIAAKLFDIFHTIDREKIVNELIKYKDLIDKKKFFIQINTGAEKTKSGVKPEELKEFLFFCKSEKKLNVCGLMCIPPIEDNPSVHFKLLSELAKDNNLEHLSIGMSNDYEEALKFNPTYIRLGTILFGKR